MFPSFYHVFVFQRLAKTAGRPTSRLLVCLGGCPNFGPGAVAPCAAGAAAAELEPEALAVATEYFKDLGKRALRQVEFLCLTSVFIQLSLPAWVVFRWL